MKKSRLYKNPIWYAFSDSIKKRDGYKCLKCNRPATQTNLQVHHVVYTPNKLPWESNSSDCITLCKSCHAKTHGKIMPTEGWILTDIIDLQKPNGTCEKPGCGHEIRYEHHISHINWGSMIVGSTCVDYLTSEDIWISQKVIVLLKKMRDFISKSNWQKGFKNSNRYFYTFFKGYEIQIHGKFNNYFYTIRKPESGSEEISKYILPNNKMTVLKELAFVNVLGIISKNKEKDFYRNFFKNLSTSVG